MKKSRLASLLFVLLVFYHYSCNTVESSDCELHQKILINAKPSHPCLATGKIDVIAPLGPQFLYKLDQGSYLSEPIFENVAVGKHLLSVMDMDGCITSNEIEMDTVKMGNTYRKVSQMLIARCAACHAGLNPHAGKDFTNACDILSSWDRILARAVEGIPTPMPSSGLIPIDERNLLIDWINDGHCFEK